MIKNLLITGANGFIGRALLSELQKLNYNATAITRSPFACDAPTQNLLISHVTGSTDWSSTLNQAKPDVIIHAAARVHQMNDCAQDPLQAFRDVNTAGTLNLARQAAKQGVKRFIFISTVKVNGEVTAEGKAFDVNQQPMPVDAYGISKAEAELGLRQIAAETKMEVVIIRSPLVYGAGVKGNFLSMIRLAKKNLPLPLGAINNKRSLVALDNLLNLIITCIEHPKAVGQTFLVSDNHDVSTTELLTLLVRAAGKKPRLFSVPSTWLQLAAKLLGKRAVIERLCGNLQVDISHTRQQLDWQPVITIEDGLKKCFAKEL
ncbi:SDR family oxidoreductase [Rheinheimera sp. MMS21-TC3]|uniref:UDP-glucose 4-epimerase family protein n=1 Tax=Rheinheimera sp. MMS21-TC3 TaxID=3072790 RepID=UPI0028C42308|nr:SDR family oxidoreductase [Rheinheimera sp. MMS21-TC3]WNO61673.1 SDR family oxidoreductase [Rheinheimera sp. MMS21-TC3]